jgi:hypothetical protein
MIKTIADLYNPTTIAFGSRPIRHLSKAMVNSAGRGAAHTVRDLTDRLLCG